MGPGWQGLEEGPVRFQGRGTVSEEPKAEMPG